MAKNDFEHPEEARRAQDLDVPGITLPEGTHHTGRGMWEKEQKWTLCEIKLTFFHTGGAANTYTPSEKEQQEALAHNEKVRSESFHRAGSKERSSIRALADKAKDTLSGKQGSDK